MTKLASAPARFATAAASFALTLFLIAGTVTVPPVASTAASSTEIVA